MERPPGPRDPACGSLAQALVREASGAGQVLRSPLSRKPPLRVDIPRGPGTPPAGQPGGAPPAPVARGAPAANSSTDRAAGGELAQPAQPASYALHGQPHGQHGQHMSGFAHDPVPTPVTPVDERAALLPHDEMFSETSPAAVLGDQVARMRVEQRSNATVRRPPPRPQPVHHDRDEGSGEVVIDIPVDVSPYLEMFMRPAPPSQGRLLCTVEKKQLASGDVLHQLVIEESNVLLLVALQRAKQRDVLISMYEKHIEANHIGLLRSLQPGMFVLEGRRRGPAAEPPWQYACIAHGVHGGEREGEMPVMNMLEVAVPNCAYLHADFSNGAGGHAPLPSPSAVVAWPPGELQRWLHEHDDTQPQRDASLLTMRLPQWNPETKLLTLNFFERAHCASSQNFQLTPYNAPDRPVLLFGMRSESTFSLDFMAPLSPFAAFGIALSVRDW
ncbi:hypothetical protein KFE25_011350 [Diacronema lutheri]|uniref:Tubby C-terminal domain-containing protein n=3 Tax=Diacronema lutheri TaxID=2081491 RepID=A0A8J5XCX2_DIALT|nr:hypothetical protein KFE25_011350 [Diacronema lutheri]